MENNIAAADDMELQNPTVRFLLHSIQQQHNEFSPPSIQIIPRRVRDLNPKAFNPRVVSIGPLHRNDENLLPFEQQKPIFLRDLLASLPEHTLETCVQKVNASIDRIRSCYEDRIKSYSDDEIARMMVMDACFILEFIYKSCRRGLFDEHMLIEPSMIFDLLLIENQIPFFVLQDMFDCTCSRFKPTVTSLNQLIIVGLVPQVHIFESNVTNKNYTTTHDHILGLIHECYRPSHPGSRSFISSSTILHSAIELDRAGVNFKPHHQDPPEWCMAIKLESPTFVCFSWHLPWAWGKPTLRMPVLCIHDYTELVLRNLIAYEQFCPLVRNYVTSYATAMDLLIDNEEDVAILVESKVVVNIIGSNEEAAKMINDICKEVTTTDFFYTREWRGLDMYYNGYWPKNIAWLRCTYFNSPWNVIALLAGIMLFLLTVVQTYFTIKPI